MTLAIIIASLAAAGAAAVYLALRTDIEPDDYEPVEVEPPHDDRWGHHKAMEDR